MRLKIRPSKRIVLETSAEGSALPAIPLPEVGLKRILAAIDFSESSRKAFHYAVAFGKQFQAEVLMLHVFEPPPPQVSILEGALMDTSLREDAAKQLAEWRRAVASKVSAKAVVRDGYPAYKEIVAAAEEVNADLIIIGHQGHNRLAQALMGSTAEKVVRHAACPVLVVRQREHDFVPD